MKQQQYINLNSRIQAPIQIKFMEINSIPQYITTEHLETEIMQIITNMNAQTVTHYNSSTTAIYLNFQKTESIKQ